MTNQTQDDSIVRGGALTSREEDRTRTDPDVGLLDLALVLATRKRLVLGTPVAVALVTAAITLLIPNVYESTARILPPQQNQSTAAVLLGQLAGVSGLGAGALGVKNPNDMYVGMLRSRTVADRLIERFDLKQQYEEKTMVLTRKALAAATEFKSGRDGIIAITVEDEDPSRAALLANAYVDELRRLTQTLAVTEASQRRLFFEKQVEQAATGLAAADVALKETQERTGLISLTDQGKAIIEGVATLRAQIAAKEVQLGAMRAFATDDNPDYVRGRQELAGMRAQLTKLERSVEGPSGNILVPTGNVPAAGLEFIRKLREVKYYETIFELMSKQLELARIDEAKDASIVQVLDVAVAADRKSKPKRALITIIAAFFAALVAVVAAFVLEAMSRLDHHPEYARKYRALRERISWRRT